MIQVWFAYVIDLLIGDPRWIPHPVVFIGKLISRLEVMLFRLFHIELQADKEQRQGTREKGAGIFLLLIVTCISGGAIWGFLYLAAKIHPWLFILVNVWFISTTIAVRGLAKAGTSIFQALQRGDLAQARQSTGWIVSRNTKQLPESEVVRATVESVAENIVDAVVAPLFYAMIGGAPLAIAYRAVNTLDSMVGYKNDKYLHFGWASARMDDLLNWIPARITGLLIVCAAWFLDYSAGDAWKMIRRDASKHPSPNSGIPEAGAAGALGIRLGGRNIYDGRESFRAYMGETLQDLSPVHIQQTIRILYACSFIMLMAGSVIWSVLQLW